MRNIKFHHRVCLSGFFRREDKQVGGKAGGWAGLDQGGVIVGHGLGEAVH